MVDQKDYIRKQVAEAVRNRPVVRTQSFQAVVPAITIPPTQKAGFLTYFLGACILLVSVATLGTVAAKSFGFDWRKPAETVVVERPSQPMQSPPTTQYMTKAEASTWMSSVDSRLESIESSLKKWNHRVWLLGVANNENAAMQQALDRKYHPNEPSDYITFDREWKLNRMPRSMKIEGAESESIRDSVR